jgi:hypothetical protein
MSADQWHLSKHMDEQDHAWAEGADLIWLC